MEVWQHPLPPTHLDKTLSLHWDDDRVCCRVVALSGNIMAQVLTFFLEPKQPFSDTKILCQDKRAGISLSEAEICITKERESAGVYSSKSRGTQHAFPLFVYSIFACFCISKKGSLPLYMHS